MKILIVEDDFASRKILQKYLAKVGECDVVVDGKEALDAFKFAWEEGSPYELICLDIMLPKMDGQLVLKEIRNLEKERGLLGRNGVKVIMTTALNDPKNIMEAFRSQCEGYLTKPVTEERLFEELNNLGIAVN